MLFLTKTTKNKFYSKLHNAQHLYNFIWRISNQEVQINPKQQNPLNIRYMACLMHFFLPKILCLT